MKKVMMLVAAVALAVWMLPVAFAQNGKGDNRDDKKSGKVDRKGDGNSGQGDDVHKKDKKNRPQKGPSTDDGKRGKKKGG